MKTKNNDIRQAAKKSGVFLYQIADELGIQDSCFSRKLRKELPDAEKELILLIIEDLVQRGDLL